MTVFLGLRDNLLGAELFLELEGLWAFDCFVNLVKNVVFRKIQRAHVSASKEKQVLTSVILLIGGDIGDPKCVSGGIPLTNLEHLTDGKLVPGNPDIFYGSQQVDRRA